jgi:heme/copper-type cytochrome/quinol oxidase subunit 3
MENTDFKEINPFEGHNPDVKLRTKKMIVWFLIFAVVMLFGGITSAIMVLYGKLLWVHIQPPAIFWVGNALIVLSSVTLIAALRALKAGKQSMALYGTLATFILGLGFVYTQNKGWDEMAAMGMGNTITQTEQGLKQSRWNTLGKLNGEYGTNYYFELNDQILIKEGDNYYYVRPDQSREDKTLEVQTTFNASGAMLSVLIYLHIAHLLFGLIYLAVNLFRLKSGKLNKDNWISLHSNGMYWHFMGILWIYLFFFIFYIY